MGPRVEVEVLGEKRSFALAGNRKAECPVYSSITIVTVLSPERCISRYLSLLGTKEVFET